MRAVFLALAIGLCLIGCRPRKVVIPVPPPPTAGASTLAAGTVIRSAGTWSQAAGGTSYTLSVSLIGKRVDWRHYMSGQGGGGGRGHTAGSIDAGVPPAPWFIYVDSPDRLWFCDGAANLSCRTWRAGAGSSVSDAILQGALTESHEPVPAEVVRLLPAELQKLFPAAAAKPRPSI